MFPSLTIKKITVIFIITLTVSLLLAGLYFYLNNFNIFDNKQPSSTLENLSSKAPTKPLFEELPPGIKLEEYTTDKALIITGNVVGTTRLENDNYYVNLAIDEDRRTTVPILLGKKSFLVGLKSFSFSKDKELNWAANIDSVIPRIVDGAKISVWIYYDTNEGDLRNKIQSQDCDEICKQGLSLILEMQPINKKAAESFEAGLKSESEVGPIGQIQIYE